MAWSGQIEMADALRMLACAIGAYAVGCFATGYYLVRAKTGRDIREIESGSTGASNVGRILGRRGFWLTVCGDFAKGSLAVLAARYFTGSPELAAIALIFVVIGHLWPAPLHWHGGKGVVTSGGAMLVFDYRILLIYGAAVAVGFALTRRTTMPGLAGFLVIPFASFWLQHSHFVTTIVATLTVLILFAHRENIRKAFPALDLRRGLADKSQPPKL
jgi:glycerol-3-phosphate acyltransferase PlsY